MDTRPFASLVRSLRTPGSRRGLLGILTALPLLRGLDLLVDRDDAATAKGRHKRHKKKKCMPPSVAVTCAGKCGPVTDTCKQAVNCGPCACTPPCPICQTCNTVTATCAPDANQRGAACGGPGQVCQGDGTCACDVCHGGGCRYGTVQDAVADSGGPETIHICLDRYFETVSIGRNLTLIGAGDGAGPARNTILNANGAGGVVSVADDVTATLRGLRITGGVAQFGGGVFNQGDSLTMTDCTVIGNAAPGGAGGGVFNERFSALTMTGCTISGNSASGIAGKGGGLASFGSATLTGCSVSGNSAGQFGGGIRVIKSFDVFTVTLTLDDSEVTANSAGASGGGIHSTDAVVMLQNGTMVTRNSPDNCAGTAVAGCIG